MLQNWKAVTRAVLSLFGTRKIEKKATSDLFSNWNESKDALIAGLNPDKKNLIDIALKNQEKYLKGTTDVNPAEFRKIMIPMIRKIMPGTLASQIIGVQPMMYTPDTTVRLLIKKIDMHWNVEVLVDDDSRTDEIIAWLRNLEPYQYWAYRRQPYGPNRAFSENLFINFYDEEALLAFKLVWQHSERAA